MSILKVVVETHTLRHPHSGRETIRVQSVMAQLITIIIIHACIHTCSSHSHMRALSSWAASSCSSIRCRFASSSCAMTAPGLLPDGPVRGLMVCHLLQQQQQAISSTTTRKQQAISGTTTRKQQAISGTTTRKQQATHVDAWTDTIRGSSRSSRSNYTHARHALWLLFLLSITPIDYHQLHHRDCSPLIPYA
jgi:hypothetical protein